MAKKKEDWLKEAQEVDPTANENMSIEELKAIVNKAKDSKSDKDTTQGEGENETSESGKVDSETLKSMKKAANKVFEREPAQDELYVTSDGNVFFSDRLATIHADKGKLHKQTIKRSK